MMTTLNDDYSQAVREATNYCIANGILSDFLIEQGGKIVSILTAEFDLDVAKRVYGDERVEDERLQLARTMIMDGEPNEKIARYTRLTLEEIESVRTKL